MHFRRYLIAAIYVALLLGGWFFGDWLLANLDLEVRPANEPSINRMIITVAGVFVFASALPFVPGAEIGFGLILVFGGSIALLVYLCMVAALLLAFLVGRFVPIASITVLLNFLGLIRAREMIAGLEPLNSAERLALLTDQAPQRFVPVLLKHRYLALLIVLNTPGNSLIGGGGGIAFIAGLSRLFSLPGFLLSVAIAVAPVPLFFYIFR